MSNKSTDTLIYNTAVKNGIVSAVINGITTWFELNSMEKIPFTLDNISNREVTVFGSVFPVVISLSIILGIINYFTFKKTAKKENLADAETLNKPFFPGMLKLILARTFSAVGLLMILAVLWQKYIGVIYTGNIMASALVGISAGLTSVYIAVSVSKEIVREK
ncbi:MAG TPA: hypothetical protein PKA90_11145 [Ignavibacteria bacterium]|nr:hypothetical protein [Ignavibacteria bacterium]HMR40973.1 hypothetical protein [Ignavibacteria bacterium]